jgi:quercetin dioxygenase-like cupin family protein
MSLAAMKGYFQLDKLPEEKLTPLISRKIITGEKEMIVLWKLKAGAHATAHKHPHEQIFWVLSGKMEFRLGDERRTCVPGHMGVIPSGVEHEAWFPEDTEVIDIFAPPREDFLTGGTPAYMRKP